MTGQTQGWLRIRFEPIAAGVEDLSEAVQAAGALAVTLVDGGDQALLEPAPGSTPLWAATSVVGLYAAGEDPASVLARVREGLGGAGLPPYRIERLRDRQWERVGMERFGPMRFGRRLWVYPSWVEPPGGEAVAVRLDPGLAFGTGAHETTALCLEWLDATDLAGCEVIDYGCGSGILGIASALLGADRVRAVDIDPQALTATRENARRNGVAARLTTCLPQQLDGLRAERLLANILAGPLVGLAPRLASLVRPGGLLLLSGLLAGQAAEVAAAYRAWFDLEPPERRGDWCRLAGTRSERGND